jgi:septum formation inhibitor-activating ATPase MinD
VTIADVTSLLGREPDVLVPSSADITRSVNEAMPIVMGHGNPEARKAFRALAQSMLPGEGAEASAAGQAKPSGGRRRRFLLRAKKEN